MAIPWYTSKKKFKRSWDPKFHHIACGIEAIVGGLEKAKQSSDFTQSGHVTYFDGNYVSIYYNIRIMSAPLNCVYSCRHDIIRKMNLFIILSSYTFKKAPNRYWMF